MRSKMLVILLAFVACVFLTTVSEARHSRTIVVPQEDNHNVAGAKLDAPNLINIDKDGNWTLGAEGGKDIIKDMFYEEDAYVEADRGYFAYVKVTYNGCLLRCGEKKVQEVEAVQE